MFDKKYRLDSEKKGSSAIHTQTNERKQYVRADEEQHSASYHILL